MNKSIFDGLINRHVVGQHLSPITNWSLCLMLVLELEKAVA